MPYRIVHITPVYPPYAGGIGVVAKKMAEGLTKRGWEVDVVTPKGGPEVSKSLSHKVIELKQVIRIGNAAVVPQIRKLERYDIIHLHYPFFGGAEWLLFNKSIKQENKKTKLVLQYHHDADASGLKGLIFKLYDRLVLPRLMKRADRVIVSSMDYAQHSRIAKYISNKFIEIPLGVDSERFKSLPISSPTRKGETERGCFTILFVGSLDRAHWFKGLEVLLHAFAILKQENEQNRLKSTHLNPALNTTSQLRHSSQRLRRLNRANPACAGSPGRAGRRLGFDLKCLVIGEGLLKEKYKKMAQELGIQDHVQFLGNVPHAQLPDCYRNADLFVFPSVSRAEAFGLVALEAMATGLPVIVSDLPGVRTLVEEGINGFKVPVNDPQALARCMQVLVEDKTLCDRMGQKSRVKVMIDYSCDKVIDKIERVYQEIL